MRVQIDNCMVLFLKIVKIFFFCLLVVVLVYGILVVVEFVFFLYDIFKYGFGFIYFDYVNLDVFWCGMFYLVNLDCCISFDKFNLMLMKGVVVVNVDQLMFEILVVFLGDEVVIVYGFLVDDMKLVVDCMLMIFYFNFKVCFNNGDKVIVEDVKYFFDMLIVKGVL